MGINSGQIDKEELKEVINQVFEKLTEYCEPAYYIGCDDFAREISSRFDIVWDEETEEESEKSFSGEISDKISKLLAKHIQTNQKAIHWPTR